VHPSPNSNQYVVGLADPAVCTASIAACPNKCCVNKRPDPLRYASIVAHMRAPTAVRICAHQFNGRPRYSNQGVWPDPDPGVLSSTCSKLQSAWSASAGRYDCREASSCGLGLRGEVGRWRGGSPRGCWWGRVGGEETDCAATLPDQRIERGATTGTRNSHTRASRELS